MSFSTRLPNDSREFARLSTEAPRVPWDVFVDRYFDWRAGEHVGLIGVTGAGKTTLLLNLLPFHPYVVAFATKPKDDTMDKLVDSGYLRMDEWRSIDPRQFPRRILWPDARDLDSDERQKRVFGHAFRAIYKEGGWTVAIDELWWFDNVLGLAKEIRKYLLQARSLKISVLAGTQRPAWVPREIYTQSTHLFFFGTNDENDLKALSGLSYRSSAFVRMVIANLEYANHQFLYLNTRTGNMCRTRCPEIPGI
jgi:energy-coupling factor transporter ATP-binding protein EcfA2